MKLSIIANPVAGRGRGYRSICRYIRRWPHKEWEVEILTADNSRRAAAIAADLVRRPPDLLAVCGGDGTLNEIASNIPRPLFPVAILPAGTANVMAHELGLPLDPVRALEIALKRKVRRVDLGRLGPGPRRRFLFVAGIGFDAFVVSRVGPYMKKKLGMAAYAAEIFRCLARYPFPEFRILAGGRTYASTSCLVCNSKSYGGGLHFCPEADMEDGLLDVLILQGRPMLGLARLIFQAWCGKALTCGWVHRIKTRTLRFEGSADVLVQTDGEAAGCLPLEVGLIGSVFPLVVP
jgi:diacylglycerol kinase (ATP)